jgi:hypothetical protein
MLIHIDNKQVEIPVEMIEQMLQGSVQDVVGKYKNIEPTYRIGIKTFLRTFVFPTLEKALKIPVRPPKELDPVEFLLINIASLIQEASNNATIHVKTTKSHGSTHRPTAFSFSVTDTSEGGRQLAFNWTEGKRQDDIRETVTR